MSFFAALMIFMTAPTTYFQPNAGDKVNRGVRTFCQPRSIVVARIRAEVCIQWHPDRGVTVGAYRRELYGEKHQLFYKEVKRMIAIQEEINETKAIKLLKGEK